MRIIKYLSDAIKGEVKFWANAVKPAKYGGHGLWVYVLILVSWFMFQCHKAEAAEYEVKYTRVVGSEISGNEAMLAALKGERVYKCQTNEFKVGKSGTSASLKNVAKPKPKADIQAQIKQLEQQLKETR